MERERRSSRTHHARQLQPSSGLSGVIALAAGTDGSVWSGMSRTGPGLGLQRLQDGVEAHRSPRLRWHQSGRERVVQRIARTPCGSGRKGMASTVTPPAGWIDSREPTVCPAIP